VDPDEGRGPGTTVRSRGGATERAREAEELLLDEDALPVAAWMGAEVSVLEGPLAEPGEPAHLRAGPLHPGVSPRQGRARPPWATGGHQPRRGEPGWKGWSGGTWRSMMGPRTTMPVEKRCGTCELLGRSTYPGLHTFGKCPHRHGWVRTHQQACEHHLGAPRSRLVRVAMLANVGVALVGLGTFVVLDLRDGNPLSHALLGAAVVVTALLAWLARRDDLLSEEPKFLLLDDDEPPPAEDDRGIDFW
jgi:hypothetical protein